MYLDQLLIENITKKILSSLPAMQLQIWDDTTQSLSVLKEFKTLSISSDKEYETINKITSDIFIENITQDSRKIKKHTLFVLSPNSLPYIEKLLTLSPSVLLITQKDFKIWNKILKRHLKQIKKNPEQIQLNDLHGFKKNIKNIEKRPILFITKNYEDLYQWQGILCSRLYNNPSSKMEIVCVTGTNGKTSVAWLLYQIWKNLSLPCAMIGTLGVYSYQKDNKKNNNHEEISSTGYTTPTAELLHPILAKLYKQNIKWVVLEVSSEGLDMGRIHALSFKAALFTNLGHDHLNYHKTISSYFKAKVRLFEMAKKQKLVLSLIHAMLGGRN